MTDGMDMADGMDMTDDTDATDATDSCTPVCEGKVCGDDGCGGVCGDCTDGLTCVEGACALAVGDSCWLAFDACGPDVLLACC